MIERMTEEAYAQLKRLAEVGARLQADENFKELLRTLKNETIRKWSESSCTAGREEMWFELHALGRLENRLKAAVETLKHEDKLRGIKHE